jgi:recombinational DNA repair protein RecT
MTEKKWNINDLDPVGLVEDAKVKEAFISAYSKIHRASKEDAEVIYDRESLYYKKALAAEPKLKNCTRISLYSALLEAAITGLSLQPGQKSEAYLESRNFNAGTKDNQKWESVCHFVLTAYGELNLRIKAGQIVRMNNPVVVYEGDHFQPMTNARGELFVDYKPAIPRKSKNIIGAFVVIHLPGNQLDFKWLLQDDIERLKGYSAKGFKGNPNALYSSNNGSIDVGFLETKTIKHAMRAYTKLRVGENVAYEDDLDLEKAGTFLPPDAQPQPEATVQYGQPESVIPGDDDGEIF